MKGISITGIAVASIVVVSCGSSGDGASATVSKVTQCVGRGSAVRSIDGDDLPVLFGQNFPSGKIDVEILRYEDIPDVISDSYFEDESFQARGNFVGVRYRLSNDLEEEIQLSSQFTESLRITDGEKSWGVADYNDDHFGAPGWEWSETNGDVGGATYVGAGFSEVTWAVYDIPVGVEPRAVGFERADGRAVCFSIEP